MLPPRLRPLLAALAVVAAACSSTATGETIDVAEGAAEDAAVTETSDATVTDDSVVIVGGGPEPAVSIHGTAPTQAEIEALVNPADDAASSAEVEVEVEVDEPVVVPVTRAEDERTITTLDPPLEPVGTSNGPATQRAQERLLELGYWLLDANGDYEKSTAQAVMAFQKYAGLETDGVLGPITAAALTEVGEHPTGRSTTGTLVEIDKGKQLVFIVQDGITRWILNTSTGSEIPYEELDQNSPGEVATGDSVTRTGLFKVNRERDEGWWEGDLGEIYRPKYFDGGIALHGSYNIPDYPASHGCVRLSIPAMDWIWENDIVPRGTPVWVHGEIPTSDDDE